MCESRIFIANLQRLAAIRHVPINSAAPSNPVHSIDADAQLSVNVKDTALTLAVSCDVDAGIRFIPASASASTSASASYCERGLSKRKCFFRVP